MSTGDPFSLEVGPLPAQADPGADLLTRQDRAALRPPWRQPLALTGAGIIIFAEIKTPAAPAE